MKTPRLVKSWLDPQLDWLDMPECLACVVPINSPGLIELIATGFLAVPLLPEAARLMLVSMVERDRPLMAALVQGIDQLSPTAQATAENTVKVYYRGIFHLTDRKEVLALVVLVPHDDAQYSFIPQALKSQAQALFGTYRAESAKWEAAEDDRKRKNEEVAASIPVDQRGLFVAAHTYGEPFRGLDRPTEPRLTPLLDLVPKATWVESLPRVQSARLHKVAQAIDQSSLRLSRDGRYAAVVARTAEGGFGAVLTWAERDLLPSYPEIRMAVTRVVPRALARPRRSDVVPPRFEPVQTRVDDPVELGNMDPNALEDAVETLRDFSLELPDFEERVERGKRWTSQAGFEAIGWYQPFHEWNEASWGIYLHAERLLDVACGLHEALRKRGNHSAGLAALLTVGGVYRHESFHAEVEAAGTWLELNRRQGCYRKYHQQVYLGTEMTDAWLEEALANWSAMEWVNQHVEPWHAMGLLKVPADVASVFADWLDMSPSGYRNWRMGDQVESWRVLASELATALPGGKERGRPLPLDSILREPLPYDMQAVDVPVRFVGHNSLSDLFFLPSCAEARKLLKHFQYELLPGRGKGGHEFWRGPDNRGFTLPGRDPLSPGVFKTLLHHFDLKKDIYIRDVRPKL